MKKRLFDFSAFDAVITCLAYAMLLTLFLYMSFTTEKNTLFVVISVLLGVSFLFLIFYFVILSVRLKENAVAQGSKTIKKKNLSYKVMYDTRFREDIILLRDKTVDYRELSEAMKKKKMIRVQATKRNLRLLSDYLGCSVSLPPKPDKKARKGLLK